MWLWFTGFYDHSALCQMFGVKSCSRNTFKRIVIVSKNEIVAREHPRMDLIMIPQMPV